MFFLERMREREERIVDARRALEDSSLYQRAELRLRHLEHYEMEHCSLPSNRVTFSYRNQSAFNSVVIKYIPLTTSVQQISVAFPRRRAPLRLNDHDESRIDVEYRRLVKDCKYFFTPFLSILVTRRGDETSENQR